MDVVVVCHQCGATLSIVETGQTWMGHPKLMVSPCASCVREASGEGFERGFQEGHHVGLDLQHV